MRRGTPAPTAATPAAHRPHTPRQAEPSATADEGIDHRGHEGAPLASHDDDGSSEAPGEIAPDSVFFARDFRFPTGRYHTRFKLIWIAGVIPLIVLLWALGGFSSLARLQVVMLWMVVVLAAVGVVLWVYAWKPMLTRHRIDDGGISLHIGYDLRARLPWSAVTAISLDRSGPRRLGITLRAGTLYALTDLRGLVRIDVDPAAGLRHGRHEFDRAVVSVTEPESFIATARAGLREWLQREQLHGQAQE